jgi:hypothetical protein
VAPQDLPNPKNKEGPGERARATDPANSVGVILKAAGEAVAYERAKPPSVAINAGLSLYDVLEKKRLECLQAKIIDAPGGLVSAANYAPCRQRQIVASPQA